MNYNSAGRKNVMNFEQEILSLYDSGILIKDICSKLKICSYTVVKYLRKNNRRRYIVHTFDDSSFSSFSPESCYWAGFLAADGNIDKELNYIMLNLHSKDVKHIEKLLNFVKDENPSIKNNGFVGYATINSRKIVQNIIDLFEVVPKKSFTLRPPNKIPEGFAKHYVRGYFDGDGCISKTKKNRLIFKVYSGSKDILTWMSKIIKNNTEYGFSDKSLGLIKNRSIYCVESSGKSAKAILDWLYKDSTPETRLDRKYERYLSYLK